MRPYLLGAACALLLFAAGGAVAASPPACSSSGADTEQAAGVVRSFYAALAADDEAAVGRLTAPGFYAYDVGKRFTAPELSAAIKGAHGSGVVLEWNLGPIDARVGCDLAWAAWENHGRVGTAAALKPMTWLESAVLRRDGGRWVMVFLHSTRAEAAN
jgi:hypothetical protein